MARFVERENRHDLDDWLFGRSFLRSAGDEMASADGVVAVEFFG